MHKTKRNIALLLPLVVFLLLGMFLFACGTSTEQERQITNAFTPGQSTQDATLQTQPPIASQTQTDTVVITPESQPGTAPLPSLQPTMMITNTQGQPIIVTQTRAATQPNQPTATRTPTNKPTNTATPRPSNTATATITLSPTQQTGWAGEWKVFWQLDNSNYVEGTITVEVVDTDFTASGTLGGVNYSFTGSIIEQGLSSFGNWTSPTSSGNFIWNNVGAEQFGGSRDTYFGFCGARSGVIPPNPCYLSPLL